MSRSIVLISASPKVGEESVSNYLTCMLANRPGMEGFQKTEVNVRQSLTQKRTPEDFKIIAAAEVVVIVFPLYIFCTPAILTRFLDDYYRFYRENVVARTQKVYAIVNCGFPEPDINAEAVRVIASFSRHVGAEFRFGIMIGGGGILLGAKDSPFMKNMHLRLANAMDSILQDTLSNSHASFENVSIKPAFPRRLYFLAGDMGFNQMAGKNGLKKKDLYRKPYRLADG